MQHPAVFLHQPPPSMPVPIGSPTRLHAPVDRIRRLPTQVTKMDAEWINQPSGLGRFRTTNERWGGRHDTVCKGGVQASFSCAVRRPWLGYAARDYPDNPGGLAGRFEEAVPHWDLLRLVLGRWTPSLCFSSCEVVSLVLRCWCFDTKGTRAILIH